METRLGVAADEQLQSLAAPAGLSFIEFRLYDAYLEVTGADGKPAMWEEESCKKVSCARAMTPNP